MSTNKYYLLTESEDITWAGASQTETVVYHINWTSTKQWKNNLCSQKGCMIYKL